MQQTHVLGGPNYNLWSINTLFLNLTVKTVISSIGFNQRLFCASGHNTVDTVINIIRQILYHIIATSIIEQQSHALQSTTKSINDGSMLQGCNTFTPANIFKDDS